MKIYQFFDTYNQNIKYFETMELAVSYGLKYFPNFSPENINKQNSNIFIKEIEILNTVPESFVKITVMFKNGQFNVSSEIIDSENIDCHFEQFDKTHCSLIFPVGENETVQELENILLEIVNLAYPNVIEIVQSDKGVFFHLEDVKTWEVISAYTYTNGEHVVNILKTRIGELIDEEIIPIDELMLKVLEEEQN